MNINVIKKRSISKPDKHFTEPNKHINVGSTIEKKRSKKRTLSIASEKQMSKQLEFRQCAFRLKLEYQRILELAKVLSSSIVQLKNVIAIKTPNAQQTYNQLKNGKTILLQEMKAFQSLFLNLVDLSTHHLNIKLQSPNKEIYGFQQNKEKAFKNYKNNKRTSHDSQSILVQQLRLELSELQSISNVAVSRQNYLQNQLSLQQTQISKYKQLLNYAILSEPLQKYFDLINDYKQFKLSSFQTSSTEECLEERISEQQNFLKELLFQNRSNYQQSLKELNIKDQRLKELTDFIETVQQNINSTNIQYSKINQNLFNCQNEISGLLEVLGIDSNNNNFFNSFISASTKIKQIHSIINGTQSTLPERIINLVSTLSFQSKIIIQYQSQINSQKKQLQQATQQFQSVTASYIQINNKHLDLVNSFKLVSSKIQMLQNHNNQLTKLINKIDQISQDESEGSNDFQMQPVDEQTIVRQLRKSQDEMRTKINCLKQQYKISQSVITQYDKSIKQKQQIISTLTTQIQILKQSSNSKQIELASKQYQIQFQRSQILYQQSRHTSIQNKYQSQKQQFLQHISKQQSQINKLSIDIINTKDLINTLQKQNIQSLNQIQQHKSNLYVQKNTTIKYSKQIQHLKDIITSQQYQIDNLTKKILQNQYQNQQLEIINQQIKEELVKVKSQLKIDQVEFNKFRNSVVILQLDSIKKNKQYELLKERLEEKENIIMENYVLINTLKSNVEKQVKCSRKTLFEELNEMIYRKQEQQQLSENELLIVPEFIQLNQDNSQGFPLAYSENISIASFHDSIQQNKTYSKVLIQLEQSFQSQKMDRFLQKFSSNKRIQQIQQNVAQQLEFHTESNHLFSNRGISQIDIQTPFFKTTSTQELFNLL